MVASTQQRRTRRRASLATLLLAFAAMAVGAPSVFAVDRAFTVNDSSDAPDDNVGDGVCDTGFGEIEALCSLRAAIQEGNAAALADTVTIGFDSGVDVILPIDAPALVITRPMRIQGEVRAAGAASTSVSLPASFAGGGRTAPMVRVESGGVELTTITIATGSAPDYGQATGSYGGAVEVETPDALDSVQLSGVMLRGRDTGDGPVPDGGALAVLRGTVVVQAHRVLDGPTVVSDVRGRAPGGRGGGIAVVGPDASLEVRESVLSSSSAEVGGGIAVVGGATASVADSDVRSNDSIAGLDPATGFGAGILADGSGTTLDVTRSKVRQNGLSVSGRSGGGIAATGDANVTVERSEVEANIALSSGGGLFVDSATLTFLDAALVANSSIGDTATDDGGGGAQVQGGGLLVVRGSSIASNDTDGIGGGLHLRDGRLEVANSLLLDNYAELGSGIGTAVPGPTGPLPALLVRNTTITGNGGDLAVGGGVYCSAVTCSGTVEGSVIAGNGLESEIPSPDDMDCELGGMSTSSSLVGPLCGDHVPSASDVGDDADRADPQLADGPATVPSFADNFAAPVFEPFIEQQVVQYYAWPPQNQHSPLVDAYDGFEGTCSSSPVDQLSQERGAGRGCDIGAYELPSTTFFVDATNDTDDDGLDGVCSDVDGNCTFRAAVQEANVRSTEAAPAAGGEVPFPGILPESVFIEVPAGEHALFRGTPVVVETTLQVDGDPDVGTEPVSRFVASFGWGPEPVIRVDGGAPHFHDVSFRQAAGAADPSGGLLLVTGGSPYLDGVLLDGINAGSGAAGSGGAVHAIGGVTTIVGSQLAGRSMAADGGAVYARGGEVRIVSSTVIGDANNGGGIAVGNGGTVAVSDGSTVSGGANLNGGGIAANAGGTVYVDDSRVFSSFAQHGGGIFVDTDNVVEVADSLVDNNEAVSQGGGIRVTGGGTLVVRRSLVRDNVALQGGGLAHSYGLTLVEDSTIAGNGAVDGGGVWTDDADADGPSLPGTNLRLRSSTIRDNEASGVGAGVFCAVPSCEGLLEATVAAESTWTGGGAPPGAAECNLSGFLTSDSFVGFPCGGYSESPSDVQGSDRAFTDLGPLQDNGGPWPTMAPAAASVLVDHYSFEGVCATDTDQRGVARPQQVACDIGAFELETPATPPTLTAGPLTAEQATVPAGGSVVPLADVPGKVVAAGVKATVGGTKGVAATPLSSVELDDAITGPDGAPVASPLSSVPLSSVFLTGVPLSSVALEGVPLSSVAVDGGWEQYLEGTPFEDVPLQSVQLTDLAELDDPDAQGQSLLASIPLSSVDLLGSPLSSVSVAVAALAGVPMSSVVLPPLDDDATEQERIERWCEELEGSKADCDVLGQGALTEITLVGLALAGAPLSSVPLSSVPMSSVDLEELAAKAAPMSSVPMSSVDVAATPMSSVPMSSVDLTGLPMSSVPMSSVPLSSVPMSSVPMSSVLIDATPMSSVPMSSVDIAGTPMSSVPMSSVPNVEQFFDCGVVDCTPGGDDLGTALAQGALLDQSTTFEILVGALAGLDVQDIIDSFANTTWNDGGLTLGDVFADPDLSFDDLTLGDLTQFDATLLVELLAAIEQGELSDILLGDLLIGILPPSSYPWENLDPAKSLIAASAGVPAVPFSLPVRVDDTTTDTLVDLRVFLPPGARYRDGSARMVGGGQVVSVCVVDTAGDVPCGTHGTQDVLLVEVRVPPATSTTFVFDVDPGTELGLASTEGDATVFPEPPVAFSTDLTVTEPFEPNDDLATATPIQADTLYVSPLATSDDVDLFRITVADGARLSVLLSNLPADYDLALYGPPRVPLRKAPTQSIIPQDDLGPDVAPQVSVPQLDDYTALGDLRLFGRSTRRGVSNEQIDTRQLAGGDYVIRVAGHDDASSLRPYALRAKVIDDPGPQCLADPLPGQGARGTFPTTVPAGTTTLFLVNERRLAAHGGTAVADVRAALEGLAARPEVAGLVVPVDGDDAVNAAYDAWDANACSVEAANDVVRAIGAAVDGLVDQLPDGAPGIAHVVIVGDDAQVPFARVEDTGKVANERGYAQELDALRPDGRRTPTSAAMAASHFLTDDPYGSTRGIEVGGRELFVPSIALGRLVETPADILAAIASYERFDGRLDAATTSSALAVGYEFLTDGTDAVADALVDAPRPRTVDRSLNDDDWDAQDLRAALTTDRDVVSLNGHADDSHVLSAVENAAGTQADLFTSDDLGASLLDGDIVFSMGCHAGTSVADLQIGAPRNDFPQTAVGGGAVLAAGTGYQFGDTEVVAYTEALMAAFADNLDSTASTGQALMRAKQAFAVGLSTVTPYDEKVLQTVTFYGLPMLRVGATDEPAPPIPAGPSTTTDPATGLVAAVVSDVQPDQGQVTGSTRGTYWEGDDGVTVTNGQPLQPRTIVPVSQPGTGLRATGALITALATVDVVDTDPVVARSTVDLGADEPEPFLTDLHFPTRFQSIATVDTAEGLLQQLVLVTGQFNGTSTSGTQRLITSLDATVLYAPQDSTDRTRPTIRSARVVVDGTVANIRATVVDDTEVVRVLALVTDANAPGTWTAVDLAPTSTPDVWSASVAAPASGALLTYVQAVDSSGNVGVFSDKGELVGSTLAPPPPPPTGGDGVVGATVTGQQDAAGLGWFVEAPTVEFDESETQVQYSVDGGPLQDYTGPFVLDVGDGLHTVEAFGADGSTSTLTIRIDREAPTVQFTVPPVVEQGSVVPITFTCADAGAGVESCGVAGQQVQAASNHGGGPELDTSTVGTVVVSFVAKDLIGRESAPSFSVQVTASSDAAPTVDAIRVPTTARPIGEVVTIEVDVSDDRGGVDGMVDFGDGIVEAFEVTDPGTTTVVLTHAYGAPGLYEVVVQVSDGRSGADATSDELVVFDPDRRLDAKGELRIAAGQPLAPHGLEDGRDGGGPRTVDFKIDARYKTRKQVHMTRGKLKFEFEPGEPAFRSLSVDWVVAEDGGLAVVEGIGRWKHGPSNQRYRFTADEATRRARIQVWDVDGTPLFDTGPIDEGRARVRGGRVRIR